MIDQTILAVLTALDHHLKAQSKKAFEFANSFITDFKNQQESINKIDEENTFPDIYPGIQKRLKSHLSELQIWLNADNLRFDHLFTTAPWEDWLVLKDQLFPAEKEIKNLAYPEITDELFKPGTGIQGQIDSFALVLFRLKAKKYQSSQNKKKNPGRTFKTRRFLEYYISNPTLVHLSEYRQMLLKLFSAFLYEAQEACVKLSEKVLSAENLEAEETIYWEQLKKQKIEAEIESYLRISEELTAKARSLKKEIDQLNTVYIKHLEEKISKLLPLAGSPLLPKTSFRKTKAAANAEKAMTRYNRNKKIWQKYLNGALEDWLKDVELSSLQVSTILIFEETYEIVHNRLGYKITPVFDSIKTELEKALERYDSAKGIANTELRRELLVGSRALVKTLRQEKFPLLLEAITQANFGQALQGFFSRTRNQIGELRDVHIIFRERDINQVPPLSKMDDVSVKELVDSEILSRSISSYNQLQTTFGKDIEKITRQISSLDQIVEFNLDAAYNLLKSREEGDKEEDVIEEAREIAYTGLERTIGQLSELEEKINSNIKVNWNKFGAIVQNFELELKKLADSEKILEMKIRITRAKTAEKIVESWNNIFKKSKELLPSLVKIIGKGLKITRDSFFRFRRATLLVPVDSTSADQITNYLIMAYQKINKMPYIYQHLFRLDPLGEERFFYGRSTAVDQVNADFEKFKQGYPAITAIVGEKGNGKTSVLKYCEKEVFSGSKITFINCRGTIYIEDELLNILVKSFGFDDVKTMDEFEEKLKGFSEKQICIIEDLHNLFLRVIDGFEVIERLLLLITNTRSKIFWIVTCGLYAWEYLDTLLHTSDYFKSVVKINLLNEEEVKQVILTRHQVSGYGLIFEADEKILKSRPYKKLKTEEERQSYIKNRYFENLADISGGNIKSALLFWLSALKEFGDEAVIVDSGLVFDYSILQQLKAEEYFSLAALVQHEYLSCEQHARIFNQNIDASRSILGRHYKKGLLEQNSDKYSVHPLLYRPVVKALKSRNFFR